MRRTALLLLCLSFALACGDDSTGMDASADTIASDGALDTSGSDTSVADADEDAGAMTACPGASLCGDNDIVVDAAWLEGELGAVDVQVVDVRDSADFLAGHIPGAILMNVSALRTTVDGIGGQVVSPSMAQSMFRGAGLQEDAAVIVYGATTTTGPARLVWTLEYFGHQRVALLDGGFETWTGETESGAVPPSASDYTITAIDEDRRVDADFIAARLSDDSIELVDARSEGEFASGHIPGSHQVDWMTQVGPDGALLGDDALSALYDELDASRIIVSTCQTGSRASVTYVVLRHLGFADVRLYDGSWAEWSTRDDLPRAP